MDSVEKAFQDMVKESPQKISQKGPPENSVLTGHIKNAESLRELRQEIAENISKSSMLRTKINKGISSGVSDKDLLIMALECISLMTGDRVFHTNIKKVMERHNANL